MTHTIDLQDIYFAKIKTKEKIYEIRLNDEKRKKIKIGDTIIFVKHSDNSDQIETTVTDLIYFDSFISMSKSIPAKDIGFNGKTEQEILNTYYSFYSKEKESSFGVVAIKVELN